jgi:hypothetical protein
MSITGRVCGKCKETKDLLCFVSTRKNEPTQNCDTCRKSEYAKNREHQLEYRKQKYAANKNEILAKMKSDEEKAKRNARNKKRRQIDPSFRISESLKVRIHEILKEYKDETCNYLLGANKIFLKKWLEYQFDSNMSWNNFATYWHIDHVIPIAFFNITQKEEQRVCFHWTNLRPLSKTANIKKHKKILVDDIITHAETICDFVSLHKCNQECYEKSIWPRLKLGYGKNNKDNKSFEDFLKSIIRSEAPNL